MKEINNEKQNKIEITIYSIYILMGTLAIITAFHVNDIKYITIATLWWALAFVSFMNLKIRNGNDEIINLQQECVRIQNKTIKTLFEKVYERKEIIKLSDIIINEKFKEPKKEKYEHRKKFFETYKDFEVPIILDNNNVLVDGYTTYLISKERGFSHVYVKRKVKNKEKGENRK